MNIKQRALQYIVNLRHNESFNMQIKAEKVKTRAFSFQDVSKAQQVYSASLFECNGDEKDKRVIKAKKAFEEALAKHKITFDALYPKEYVCEKCHDACVVNGTICSCSIKNYVDALRKESGLGVNTFTFDDANLEIIKDEKAKANLEKAYHQMKVFVDKYPNVKKNTFVFSGLTGTGKTCLSQAVANGLLNKGFSVKYVSAFKFNNDMIAVRTAPIEHQQEMLEDYITSDLLIIDDLGTEPITRNVTLEYLYLIISTRQERNVTTIISTNLDGDGIMTRYQERIFSRLTSKAFSLSYNFEGVDLRKL